MEEIEFGGYVTHVPAFAMEESYNRERAQDYTN